MKEKKKVPMTDDVLQLEAEIEARQARIRALKSKPMTSAEAGRLAKEDPTEFNRRFEAAKEAGRNPITYTTPTPKETENDDD